MLKSVGITSESLEKMLNIESVLCSGKALVTGLPVGILLVLIMGYCVKMVFLISSYALGSHSDCDCSFFWSDLGYGEGFFEYIKKTEHYRNNTNTLRGCSLTYFDERLAK